METIVDCHDVMVELLAKEKSPEELASIVVQLTREIERLNALTSDLKLVGTVLPQVFRPQPGPWCRDVLLYSPDNHGDSPEWRVPLYTLHDVGNVAFPKGKPTNVRELSVGGSEAFRLTQ